MKKSVIITVMIDNVSYSDIEEIETVIQETIEQYDDKRVTVTVQDTPLLSLQTR